MGILTKQFHLQAFLFEPFYCFLKKVSLTKSVTIKYNFNEVIWLSLQ